jgi:lipopolysaccharide export system protein LptC
MYPTGDLYSKTVAWMKILLPLAALALLSTLFLISSSVDPTKGQADTEINLEQRANEQGASNPSFSGVTSGGDEVSFHASLARPDPNDPNRLIAEDVSARLKLAQGTVVDVTARNADLDQRKQTSSLDGSVMVVTTNGYRVTTDRLEARFDRLHAESPGSVAGEGPPGEITAGRMLLTSDTESGNAELVFTDGVKLIYRPGNPRND